MKKLVINAETFGPFDEITEDLNSYSILVNGSKTILPKSVVGTGTITDWQGALPLPPAVDLTPLRLKKNDEINAARLKANFTTFNHAGKAIACDELSRSDIDGTNGYIALNGSLPPGWPGGWKAVDNTYVAITTVADWKAFYLSMFAAGNANFAKAQSLKQSLASATTVEQINAINW